MAKEGMRGEGGSVHGDGGVCVLGEGMCGEGGMHGRGACMVKWGIHDEGGMCGEGRMYVAKEGMCGKGGGHVWQERWQRRACVAKGGCA